jgi:hypothetical protein
MVANMASCFGGKILTLCWPYCKWSPTWSRSSSPGFPSFVSPSTTSSIGKILPVITPGELTDINGHHLVMGLREMFSPCILDMHNFIAEYYDRITSNAIAKQGTHPTAVAVAFC